MRKLILCVVYLIIAITSIGQTVKISQMPTSTNNGQSAWIPIVQNGINKKILVDSLMKDTTLAGYLLKLDTVEGKPRLNVYFNEVPEFDNNNAALSGGLEPGKIYSLPDIYGLGSFILAVVKEPPVFTPMVRIENDGDGSGGLFLVGSSDFEATVDWGDGNTETFTSSGNVMSVSHTYDLAGDYSIKILFDDITLITRYGIDFGLKHYDIRYLNLLTNVTDLRLSSSPNLTDLDYSKLPVGLTALSMNNSGLTSFNPLVALPTGLTQIGLTGNQLTQFLPSLGLPSSLSVLNISSNLLTQAEVNSTLIYLDGLTFDGGIKNLDISQGGGSPPSSAGLTAKASLEGKGWVITSD